VTTEITGEAQSAGVSARVHPGGALAALALTGSALDLGAARLSATIVAVVAEATERANRRTHHALRDALTGLDERDLNALGLDRDETLTEQVESTTPQTWRTA